MPTPTIADVPAGGSRQSWPSGQVQEVSVPCTLRSGTTTADYTDLTLTIWRDPEWPRTGAKVREADLADPDADGWEVAASESGEWDDDDTAVFEVETPAGAGDKRYALKVTALRGGQLVVLVKTCWLTVTA